MVDIYGRFGRTYSLRLTLEIEVLRSSERSVNLYFTTECQIVNTGPYIVTAMTSLNPVHVKNSDVTIITLFYMAVKLGVLTPRPRHRLRLFEIVVLMVLRKVFGSKTK